MLLIGAGVALIAALQFRAVVRMLGGQEIPRGCRTDLGVWLDFVLAIATVDAVAWRVAGSADISTEQRDALPALLRCELQQRVQALPAQPQGRPDQLAALTPGWRVPVTELMVRFSKLAAAETAIRKPATEFVLLLQPAADAAKQTALR